MLNIVPTWPGAGAGLSSDPANNWLLAVGTEGTDSAAAQEIRFSLSGHSAVLRVPPMRTLLLAAGPDTERRAQLSGMR